MTAASCARSRGASWRRTASTWPRPATVSRHWTRAARNMPDCVLLDWNMPVMNGLEFLKQLRAEFGPDKPPVVFCTTETEMSAIELAITNGAQEYIMKPFDEEILIGKFEQVGLL